MMHAVLGIDAAWTERNPSGVALVCRQGARWRQLALAPSYASFYALARGEPVDWNAPQLMVGTFDAGELLGAAHRLAGAALTVIAVDMPLADQPIVARRQCDNAISRAFGKFKCGTHSPTRERPGLVSHRLSSELAKLGFALATASRGPANGRSLIEVYPHPALVRLKHAPCRLQYKAAKTGKYWPGQSPAQRRAKLLGTWRSILDSMEHEIEGVELALPRPLPARSPARLKRYEDALDALICAWVGVCFLEERATAYGDPGAAIWVPSPTSGAN